LAWRGDIFAHGSINENELIDVQREHSNSRVRFLEPRVLQLGQSPNLAQKRVTEKGRFAGVQAGLEPLNTLKRRRPIERFGQFHIILGHQNFIELLFQRRECRPPARR